MANSVNYKSFLDTNFFVSLIDSNRLYHKNANDYFESFLINNIQLYTSSIVIAEFCVKQDISLLPLKNLKIMSFDLRDAQPN